MKDRLALRLVLGLILSLSLETRAGFAPPVLLPIEGGSGSPVAIAAGDLDRDGHPDLVTANEASGDVSILLGDGSRRFRRAARSPVPIGGHPQSVALGDVNGDGWLDLVTGHDTSHVTVLLGGPGLSFTPATGSPFSVGLPYFEIASLGDLNRDGRLDLVVAAGDGHARILLGDGTGSFTSVPNADLQLGSPLYFVSLADVNGDGWLDLVTVTQARRSDGDIVIRTLLGNGTLQLREAPGSPAPIAVPLAVSSIGDVDRDGRLDLVALDLVTPRLVTLLGDGDGGFRIGSETPVRASAAVLVDANQDGVLDVAAVDSYTGDVTVSLGNTSGGFIEPTEPPLLIGVWVADVATGDLDGDGRLDLVTANPSNRSVSLLRQQADGSFVPSPGSPVMAGLAPWSVAVGADGGGRVREILLVGSEGDDGLVSVLLPDGAGSFAPADPPAIRFDSLARTAIGDLDGDGWLDVVAIASSTLDVTLGRSDGSFAPVRRSSIWAGVTYLLLKDVTGDGRPDLVTTSYFFPSVSVLRGDGLGGFSEVSGSPFLVGWPNALLASADVNGDGKADLLALGYPALGWEVTVLLGDGQGGFTSGPPVPITLPYLSSPAAMTAADVNGDGRADLLLSGNDLVVLLGDGLGHFLPAAQTPAYVGAPGANVSLSVADLDRDGKPDLVIGEGLASRVALLYDSWVAPASLTAIAGTPQEVVVLNPSAGPLSVVVRDAAGSPVPDVVVAFDAPVSGAGGTFPGGATALTSALGEASVPFRANGTTGRYAVTASIAPHLMATVAFSLTNVDVSIEARQVSVSRGATTRPVVARIAGRDPGALTVSAIVTPPGLALTGIAHVDGTVVATIAAVCTAPLGPSHVTLQVSDGVHTATSDLVVEVTSNASPPVVTTPSPTNVIVTQSTCVGGPGATLQSLQARHPAEHTALARFLDTQSLTATDDCTSNPTRLPPQRVAFPWYPSGVDITETMRFPVGTNYVRFSFSDDAGNVGSTHGLVLVLQNGDLDLGGTPASINVFDTVILASYLVGNLQAGSYPFVAPLSVADVNADSVVDVFDLVLLAGYIVGNVACLAP